jgi:hypothetical protein
MNKTLFEKFKELIPDNATLIEESLKEIVGEEISMDYVKDNFSNLVDKIEEQIYERYLNAEKKAGNIIISKFLLRNKDMPFTDLKAFFMSISQSRKVRAGKVFETIISHLFKKLEYPFEEQVIINGKPDFLLPSKEAYENHPMDCIIFTAKRTLRERWRQIVTEGTKAYGFFLTTLDDDITKSQVKEMSNNKIYIVLPHSRIEKNEVYKIEKNVISYEYFFKYFLDPAVERWNV